MSSLIDLLTEIFRFFSNLFTRKKDEKDELSRQIKEKQEALAKALEEGRVTDAGMIRKELSRLIEKYSRKVSANCTGACIVLVFALFLSGCVSSAGKHKTDPVVFVNGDRINLVKPGDEIVVPDLVEPAKQWYLVDNVGLQYWLGIITGLGVEFPKIGGSNAD